MKAQDTKRIIGCDFTKSDQTRASGSWDFTSDASANVTVKYDGSYAIRVRPAAHVVTVPEKETYRYAPTRGMDCYGALSSSDNSYLTPPSAAWGYQGSDVKGTIDLRSATAITGSQTTQIEDGSVVTVTWDLKHEGLILPPVKETLLRARSRVQPSQRGSARDTIHGQQVGRRAHVAALALGHREHLAE
jgi:hypothetical protein